VVKVGQTFTGDNLSLRFPLFVKPTSLGGGEGVDTMSVVHNQGQLLAKVSSLAANHLSDILIEEYLPGREFSVAVLKDEVTGELTAMPIEMLPGQDVNGDKMLSQALKSAKLETPVQAVAEPGLRAELIDLAINAITALGARDYGRIDIRLDADGVPSFIEANLIPCLIRGSGNFPKACLINRGIGYQEMLLSIVELGLSRARPAFSGISGELPSSLMPLALQV
jgi:D-alanine-D-alanine ligase